MSRGPAVLGPLSAALVLAAGCGNQVFSNLQAQRGYLGLDRSVGKSMGLVFSGFNQAVGASIPTQTVSGDLSGVLSITGQVDQTVTYRNDMRLRVGMVDYSDGEVPSAAGR